MGRSARGGGGGSEAVPGTTVRNGHSVLRKRQTAELPGTTWAILRGTIDAVPCGDVGWKVPGGGVRPDM